METTQGDDEFYDMVEQIDQVATGLTDWEISFIEGLLESQRKLSPRQRNIINDMYDKYIINRGVKW